MVNSIKKNLLLVAVLATMFSQSIVHAGTLGSATTDPVVAPSPWVWSWSYENIQFTRASITLDNGTIIAAPTFDITENPDSFVTDSNGVTTGTGSALFKGILKITHGGDTAADDGEAWAEFQMKWPEVSITISSEEVTATDSTSQFTFYKESRVYKVELVNGDNSNKLTDGFKRVIPEYPRNGVYDICDGSDASKANENYFYCYQEIGYGTVDFNPADIFQDVIAASGLEVLANIGFYWDEVCLAFNPDDLDVQVDGQDYNLKEDDDGYFRSCEGRSIVFNACFPNAKTEDVVTDPVTGIEEKVFDCNDTNTDDQHFTFTLNAASGDRLEPAPATTCIGTNVEDWLALSAYSETGEDLVITPCDPSQDYMRLPYNFSDSSIAFTSSEGDNAQIDNLQITAIATADQTGTTLVLQESPDKTDSVWDFSNIMMRNISSISSLELNDTVTGTAGTDVLLGGNGTDSLHGFSGDDCIDGQQNDDNLWGDGHANDADAGERGADVFVLTSKLGKDNIHDFSVTEGDKIVNASGASAIVTNNNDGTFTVALKGQNYVNVTVLDGALEKDVNVIDAPAGLSAYPVCKGHPLF